MDDRAARENVRRLLSAADARTRREDVDSDVEGMRGLSPEQRDVRLQAVVRVARQQRLCRDHPEELLAPDPPRESLPEILRHRGAAR